MLAKGGGRQQIRKKEMGNRGEKGTRREKEVGIPSNSSDSILMSSHQLVKHKVVVGVQLVQVDGEGAAVGKPVLSSCTADMVMPGL